MYPVLFTIGSFNFTTHGLFAVLGIILAALFLSFLAKKSGLKRDLIFDNIVYAVFFGIIGARITYFILYRDQFESFSEIYQLWSGGMVSYGGFLLSALVFIALFYYQKQPLLKWFDLLAIAFPFGLFLGRIGNVLAGEYSGVETSRTFNLEGYVPVTLYEGILVLVIALSLFFIFHKKCFKKDGLYLISFLFLYGSGRFVIDFWRDENSLIFNISLGQLASLLVLFFSIFLIFKLNVFKLKGKNDAI